MKVVLQRALASRVEVNNEIVGQIDHGLVLLVCFEVGDSTDNVDKAVTKILNMRIFPDKQNETGKMDLNISQVEGSILAISQFTLSWNGVKGNRPSFDRSMGPQQANILFKIFCDKLREKVSVQTGAFGEHMNVHIQNDGPVTFSLDF